MGIDRTRRITFEECADLYNEVRTSYPEALFDDIVTLSGIPPGGGILEIGCGPGNATVPLARRGYRILAIELGERLAALAAKHCRHYPDVEIVHQSFEDWPTQAGAFDLAVAADAFHWIPPEIGYPKVAESLKPDGSAAFFWRVPVDPKTEWSRAIEVVYQSVAPDLDNSETIFSYAWLVGIIKDNFATSGRFGPVIARRYVWTDEVTSERYLKMLRTYSGHRHLDSATRERLYAGIAAVIEGVGGCVEHSRCVALFHAKCIG